MVEEIKNYLKFTNVDLGNAIELTKKFFKDNIKGNREIF